MDGELVPAITSDRATSSEVAFVAGVEEGRIDGFVFSDTTLTLKIVYGID